MQTAIQESLRLLLDGISRSDGTVVAREMERLDALLAEGRPRLHPQLAHFLERRSYAKALQYLTDHEQGSKAAG